MRFLIRTLRAGIDPGLREFAELPLSTRGRLAAFAGRPAPSYQIVMGQMLLQQRDRPPAIARGILHLLADLAERFPLPRHLDPREPPARMARNALVRRAGADQGEVLLGVTGRAGQARNAGAALPAICRRHMLTMIRALQRMVPRRMAIHAARMGDHLGDL